MNKYELVFKNKDTNERIHRIIEADNESKAVSDILNKLGDNYILLGGFKL